MVTWVKKIACPKRIIVCTVMMVCLVLFPLLASAVETHKETETLSTSKAEELTKDVTNKKLKKAIAEKKLTIHSTRYYRTVEK